MRARRLAIPAAVACLSPYLVAWGCVLFAPLDAPAPVTPFRWLFPTPPDWPDPNRLVVGKHGTGVAWFMAEHQIPLPGHQSADAPTTEFNLSQIEVRAGWPHLAVAARIWSDRHGPESVAPTAVHRSWASGVRIGNGNARGMPYSDAGIALGLPLPLVPLWPGFAVNAGWALLAVMPIPLAIESRRWLRRLRGRCPACAHTLLSDQARCPECGALRTDG